MRSLMVSLVLLLASAYVPGPAGATQHYQPWANPDGTTPDARLQGFVDKLNAIIGEAEKARAADPRLLRDLKALADKYKQPLLPGQAGRPSTKQLFADDFADGDFTRNPAWTVTQGKFWIEAGWGLRSAVKHQAQPEQKRSGGRDDAAAIFGQILQQALDPKGRNSGGGTTTTTSAAQPAAIRTDFRLANGFTIEFEFSSWIREDKTPGRLEIGATQGGDSAGRSSGYFLAYGQGGLWELLRRTATGTRVIDSRQGAQGLEDKKTHRIVWTRRADGLMTVSVDGQETLKAADQGFRDAFDGLGLVNRGGDYIVKRVQIYATQ
ncbi:MAG: hypothetical protein HQ512_13570 [Rhodospirillales bacterium]|nr:hypothetical protein [Rhodospirillales bacterium]